MAQTVTEIVAPWLQAVMYLTMIGYYSYQLWVFRKASPLLPQLHNKTRLRKKMAEVFNLSELKGLAFDLEIDYEVLPVDDKSMFIIGLLSYCERRNMMEALLGSLQVTRPNIAWDLYR